MTTLLKLRYTAIYDPSLSLGSETFRFQIADGGLSGYSYYFSYKFSNLLGCVSKVFSYPIVKQFNLIISHLIKITSIFKNFEQSCREYTTCYNCMYNNKIGGNCDETNVGRYNIAGRQHTDGRIFLMIQVQKLCPSIFRKVLTKVF